MFEMNQRIAVVQPTGTGKSFLYLKWIEEHPTQRICVASPSNYIFMQLREYLEQAGADPERLTSVTYTRLALMEQEEIGNLSIDFIVLDEFHRCGAREWGRGVNALLDTHPEAKVLGMSATPVRYLDDCRDIAEELSGELERLQNRAKYLGNERLRLAVSQKIKTLNVYYQQLGRALACSDTKQDHPLVFDLVNNFENNIDAELTENLVYQLRQEMVQAGGDIEFQVFDYILDIQEIMQKIRMVLIQSRDVNFQALKDYVQDEGHFPARREIKDGLRLGDWCSVQRAQYKKGLLSSERIKRMEEIGFSWDVHEDAWNTNYRELCNYVRLNGSLSRSCDQRSLYNWIKLQKAAKTDGSLDKIHEQLLVGLGVDLEGNHADAVWEKHLHLLQEFLRKEKRLPKRGDVIEGVKIGGWVYEQQRNFTNGTLTKQRRQRLSHAGLRFGTRGERTFVKNFALLENYIKEYGDFPKITEVYQDFGLGAWCLRLREQYAQGGLSEEQIQKLKSLGFDFRTAREIRQTQYWENCYTNLKRYTSIHGSLPKSREECLEMKKQERWNDNLVRKTQLENRF